MTLTSLACMNYEVTSFSAVPFGSNFTGSKTDALQVSSTSRHTTYISLCKGLLLAARSQTHVSSTFQTTVEHSTA